MAAANQTTTLDSASDAVASTWAHVPRSRIYLSLALGLLLLFLLRINARPASRYPFINYDKSQWTYFQAKRAFASSAKAIIQRGFDTVSGPFNVVTGLGPQVLLSPDLIDAVNAEPGLDFNAFTEQENLSRYETFRNFRTPPHRLFDDAVIRGLTRSLPKFTKPLSEEMTLCLQDTWGDSPEWHDMPARKTVLAWVARLSSRIFNGEELCRNKEWVRITVDYTVNSFMAIMILKFFPEPLIWLGERFLPLCRRVRADRRKGLKIIKPILEERKRIIAAAAAAGVAPDVPDDSIEWFRTAAKGRDYNDVDLQMGLAMAAIHTTSDLLGQALVNLASMPELVEPLRREAIEVLGKYGLQKVALTELRLMDSFFKETQRVKPIGMVTMNRLATKDVELPGGIVIRKGERTAISSHRMWSAEYYERPEQFDAYRFLERRKQPGLESKSLLISTSTDHTAFSHGKHACPGRFFAANEVKIALLHVLLKYDVRIKDRDAAQWGEYGTLMYASPKAEVQVRRRVAEVDLEALARSATV